MTGNIIRLWHKTSQSSVPKWFFVALSLVLAYQLASLTWHWLAPPWQNSAYNSFDKLDKSSTTKPTLSAAIVPHHLFGEYQQQTIKVEEPTITAPETKLKLELRGVISTGDTFGAAIIADASKNESYYRVGDKLPGNVQLHEVFSDRVILDRGGLYETLSLPTAREIAGLGATKSRSTQTTSSVETTALLQDYRQKLQNNPRQLMGLVRTFPVRRSGRLIGYRIAPGKDRKLLAKFGLRSGDIVTSVNGIPLTSTANGLSVMKKMNSASNLSIEVERNGSRQSFEFSLN